MYELLYKKQPNYYILLTYLWLLLNMCIGESQSLISNLSNIDWNIVNSWYLALPLFHWLTDLPTILFLESPCHMVLTVNQISCVWNVTMNWKQNHLVRHNVSIQWWKWSVHTAAISFTSVCILNALNRLTGTKKYMKKRMFIAWCNMSDTTIRLKKVLMKHVQIMKLMLQANEIVQWKWKILIYVIH